MKKLHNRTAMVTVLMCLVIVSPLPADVKSRAAMEVAEALAARLGSKAVSSVPTLAARIEALAARYGDEALVAVRRLGPEAFSLVEEAGVNGAKAVGVLAQHGELGATWVLRRPKAMQQLVKYGEEAAAVLVKHPGVAEPLVERSGASAIQALAAVNPQSGRRLAMLMEGDLGKAAQCKELLEVVGRYGQRACDFIWANKEVLAGGAVLASFVSNPEPYISGTLKLTSVAANAVAKPLVEGVARGTNWTVVFLAAMAIGAVGLYCWHFARRHAKGENPPIAACHKDGIPPGAKPQS